MDRLMSKTFGAFVFAIAVVKFAFCVPLQSDDDFERRLNKLRRD